MTIESIVENGAFAHNEQMLHFQRHSKLVFSFLLEKRPIHHILSLRMGLKIAYGVKG